MGTPPIRTRPDGTKYPVTGGKGRGTVAAVALGGVVATGWGLSGAGGSAVDSGLGHGARAKADSGKSEARKGRSAQAWSRAGLRQVRRTVRHAADCAAHSFGQVRPFLLTHPCRGLDRAALLLGDGSGGSIAVTVAWVRMRGSTPATELRGLIDTDGTGSIYPIASPLWREHGVRFNGEHYSSDRDAAVTTIAEAAPAAGRPSADTMDVAAEIASALPPP